MATQPAPDPWTGPVFVISLDFELHWGVRDHARPDGPYRANLLGVRKAVPAMLDRFAQSGIHVTWATVGALFAESRDELAHYWPEPRPNYVNRPLDPYGEPVGDSEKDDPLHFAGSLVERIARAPHQEIASHTFTHYYACEAGQDGTTFEADLASAVAIAKARGITMESLVLPRNQVNLSYAESIRSAGFTSFRGNQCGWMHGGSVTGETLLVRGARLVDAYLPLSGDGAHQWPTPQSDSNLLDIPASRFLRPWSRRLEAVEPLRIRRITTAMTAAAATGRLFHLWWHPHNFGVNLDENLHVLDAVLSHYRRLQQEFGMRSLSMREVTAAVDRTVA